MVSFLNCLAIKLPQYNDFVNFWNPNNSHTRLANLCKYVDGHDYNNLETWSHESAVIAGSGVSAYETVYSFSLNLINRLVKGFPWSVVGRKIMLSWFLIALKFSPRFVVSQKCSWFLIKLYNRNPVQYNQSKLKAWFTISCPPLPLWIKIPKCFGRIQAKGCTQKPGAEIVWNCSFFQKTDLEFRNMTSVCEHSIAFLSNQKARLVV